MADASNPDMRELQSFVQEEQQKQAWTAAVHTLTGICWDKCMSSRLGSSLSNSETTCLENCVGRFMETNLFIMKRIVEKKQ